QGLEQSVFATVLRRRCHYQRLVDQAAQNIQRIGTTDGCGSGEVERSSEDRQTSEERLLGRLQQCIAPLDCCAQSLLSWRHVAPSNLLQEFETRVQSPQDFSGGQQTYSCRRQLKREWEVVKCLT